MGNIGSNNELRGQCRVAGLLRGAMALAGVAVLLSGCIKEPLDACGPGSGPDGDVTVGFRPGTLTVAGVSGDNDGWNSRAAEGGRLPSRSAGVASRAGLPPTGMVEGAFQIGDLWVDGNRGKGIEKGMTWAEATAYCQGLGLRLPTESEMRNEIIPYVQANDPLPDNRKFEFWYDYGGGGYTEWNYWTSTPRAADASYVWYANLRVGYIRMDGYSADYKDISARCVKRDGELPPAPDPGPEVENPDGLPVGTTFRVLVYKAGDDPQRSVPVAQNTYKVADEQGTIVSTAVDEHGNAVEGETHEIVLRRGGYDFYYFSPAVTANVATQNLGTYTGLINGVDYMALVQRQVIDPSKGHKHYIPEVCFHRMGSYIDVRISPREGEILGTLEVSGEGLQLWGLPKSGSYEIGGYPYLLSVGGDGGMVEFAPASFAAEENKTATVSTLGTQGGRAVLPGYASELKVKVSLTSDGKEMKLDASLADHVFEPGYRYVVELVVGRIADKPTLDIEILPWNEHEWGDGTIGGDGLYPGQLRDGGVIYWVNPDNASDYRVVALDQASLVWAPIDSYVLGAGAQSETARNGAELWTLAKASSEGKLSGESGDYATDYPAFAYCYNKTDGGVAKGTWYLPSKQELSDLYAAKGTVESVITANGGVVLSSIHWSATESRSDDGNALVQNFGTGNIFHYSKPTSYNVRCVRDKRGISSATVSPAGDIPGQGATYSVTLTGSLPSDGVEVRAQSGGTALVSGRVATSGQAVQLAVPANRYPNPVRQIVFEYKMNEAWVKIEERTQLTSAISVGDVVDGGVLFWFREDNPGDRRIISFVDTGNEVAWSAKETYVIHAYTNDITYMIGSSNWGYAQSYSQNNTNGATGDFAVDFPAFAACYNYTPNGEPKGTWWLPARGEFLRFLEVRDVVEQVILERGGTDLKGKTYWTSTQLSEDGTMAYVWDSGSLEAGQKKTRAIGVRCCRR